MVSKISEGIEISIESFYQKDYSNPLHNEYMFAYRITIENHNAFPVKLLRRYWEVFDSNTEQRIVEGEGVVGVQPIIMENIENRSQIQVKIPAFKLAAPTKLN